MATIFETGDSDFFDTPGQSMTVGDTFQGTSDLNDTNDTVFVPLTAGQVYSVSLNGISADLGAFTLFFDDFGGTIARVSEFGTSFGSSNPVKDLVISKEGFSFNFVAPQTANYAFGQLRSDWDAGAVTYQLTVEDFVPVVATSSNDNLYGSDIGETIDLGDGDDRFVAGSGADSIVGGSGNDRLLGHEGNDTLRGGGQDDHLSGGAGDDVLNGGSGRDKLRGGDDNDLLRGHSGNDHLNGNNGNDTLYGGDNNDRLHGGAGDDTLNGEAGNDKLYGGSDNDLLIGESGKDLMFGGAGADTLEGGLGRDRLEGNAGADVFVFGTDMQRDVIVDFEDGVDKLDFSGHGFSDLSDLTFVQFGNDARIFVDSANFVVLRDTDVGVLDVNDFIL